MLDLMVYIVLIFYTIIIIIVLLIIVIANQNAQKNLAKMRLFLQIQERLQTNANFKKIEEILDKTDSIDISQSLGEEKIILDEYLRFFDSIVLLDIPNYFSKTQSDYLFAQPSALLRKHIFVRNYIIQQNYKNLGNVLNFDTDNLIK